MTTRVCFTLLWAAVLTLAANSGQDRHFSMQMGHPFNNRAIEVRGSVQFTDDDRDVKAISPGGFLRVEEGGWTQKKRVYEVRADGRGGISRTYSLGGQNQALDADARAWVGSMMLSVIRESGIGASERVQRILAKGGPLAVLAEVGEIQSDGAKRVYLTELVSKGRLTDADLRDALRAARKISSDGDKAGLLIDVAPSYLRPNLRESWFAAAGSIGSDGDRQNVLRHAITRDGGNPDTLSLAAKTSAGIGSDGDKAAVLLEIAKVYRPEARQPFIRAAGTIGSDGDRRNVLTTVIKSGRADRDTLADVLRTAADIGSDGDKAALLSEAAQLDLTPDPVRKAFFAAAESIGSDGDHAAVLKAVLRQQKSSATLLAGVAESVKQISSDGDKSAVLTRLAESKIFDPEVARAFFDAVNSVSSDGDKANVLSRLLRRASLPPAAVVSAVESAAAISSDGDKASVLVLAAQTYGADPTVREALQKALPSVHSDGDYRRVSNVLIERR